MEEHMTPERIANSIMQDSSFQGEYLLVEGSSDIKVYTKFFNSETVRIKQTFGKYKQREVYSILSSRGFTRKLGIRDADFLRIAGNSKYSKEYSDHIFITDGHDSEVMMINSSALENFLIVISNQEKVSAFEKKKSCTIRELLLNLARPIGCLRLANKRYSLGLSFKPEKADGNKIKFRKFICEKKIEFIGNDQLINTVFEYSRSRNEEIKSRELIKEKLEIIQAEDHPLSELVNGHDLAEILLIVAKKGLGSSNPILQDSGCIEDSLAMAFDYVKFSQTDLFCKVRNWEKSKNTNATIKIDDK